MLDGLVAVRIVTHVHNLHLADFMDDTAIVAVVENGGHDEDGVEHLVELLATAHQVDESLRVVEDTPGVVPRVTFGEGITPLIGREGTLEGAVLVATAHELILGVEDVLVVQGVLLERSQFLLALTEGTAELVDTPVIVGIL